jgi:hypothetical protein
LRHGLSKTARNVGAPARFLKCLWKTIAAQPKVCPRFFHRSSCVYSYHGFARGQAW